MVNNCLHLNLSIKKGALITAHLYSTFEKRSRVRYFLVSFSLIRADLPERSRR